MSRPRLPLFDEARPNRRRFLEMVAGAAVVASAGACHRERTLLLPYSSNPTGIVPGNFLSYATTFVEDGWAQGLLVATREGRPIKVEGNPDHPASQGATGPYEQACLMDLYNPSRARAVLREKTPVGFRSFLGWFRDHGDVLATRRGEGLRFLLEPSTSPHVLALRSRILERFPNAKFYSYAPLARDNVYAGTARALGRSADTRYDIAKAKVVVGFGADLLTSAPGRLAHARSLANRRDPSGAWMSRIYAIEAELSLLGMLADHRWPVRSADIEQVAWALLGRIAQGVSRKDGSARAGGPNRNELQALASLSEYAPPSFPATRLDGMASDLLATAGENLVLAGARQPALVHALTSAINELLGNQGTTVSYAEPSLLDTVCGPDAVRALVEEIDRGLVDTLLIDAFDPVYSAPADLEFGHKLTKVSASVYLSMYGDSTSDRVQWHLPRAHDFESWGDARAFDGTISIGQRLIEPLFGGVTLTEVLAALVGEAGRDSLSMLQDFWRSRRGTSDFDRFWQEALRRGSVEGTALAPLPMQVRWSEIARAASSARTPKSPDGIELNLLPDLTVHDGRHSENGWLLELPDPVTRLSWQNAALVAPAFAARHDLAVGDEVRLEHGARSLRAPVMVVPMMADETVSLSLGWGRRPVDRVGGPHPPTGNAGAFGVDAYALRTTTSPWFATGLRVEKTGTHRAVLDVQGHGTTAGRPITHTATWKELQEQPDRLRDEKGAQESLYPPYAYPGLKWAMAIDLTRCIGCATCVVACNAENNIPVVGPEQVAMGREMHWLRIDRYFEEGPRGTEAITMPLACVHCENAPCEYVCPVNATVHSSEGINQMVYNRCVGTRFCSNNCPYKVRRFNFYEYQRRQNDPVEHMRMNPEVTVRSRGVMEKCTYCIQRIERARITTQNEERPLRGEDVTTACQQACPTSAIVFGSLDDRASRVSRLHADARSYLLLHELGTRPRTAHLARIRNPNPDLG